MNTEFRMLPLTELQESAFNPRRHFDEAALRELTDSVKTKGVLVPLLVRPLNGHFEIIAGARRFRAAQAAELAEVPVRVRDLDDVAALEVATIENLQRSDVHPIDEAAGYQALLQRANYDVEAIAAKVGKSVTYVYQRLKLIDLIEPAREACLKNEITPGHALLLARLQPKDQVDALDACYHREWEGGHNVRSGARSLHELRGWIDNNLHLDLQKAGFDTAAADLVPAAGSCTECPKRTGFNTTLFQDLATRDLCTDRACFHAKVAAVIKRQEAERKKARQPALVRVATTYTNAKGVLSSHQWTEAKRPCKDAVPAVIVEGERAGAAVSVCRNNRCKVHHLDTYRFHEQSKPKPKTEAEKAAEAKERERRGREGEVKKRALVAVLDRVVSPLPKKALVALLADQYFDTGSDELEGLFEARYGYGSDAASDRKRLEKATEKQLLEQLVISLLGDALAAWTGIDRLQPLAKAFDVDIKKIDAQVAKERAAAAGAAAKDKKTKATNKRTTRGSAPAAVRGTCRVCGCTDDHACEDGCFWLDETETLCSSCGTLDENDCVVEKEGGAAKAKTAAKKGRGARRG